MSTRCPDPAQLVALEDGEATENDAAALRAHVNTCPSCAAELAALGALRERLHAPVVNVDVERVARAVEREIRAPAQRRRSVWFGMAAAFAACAALAIGVFSPTGDHEAAEFAARGGSTTSGARRDVALSLFESRGDRLLPVSSGITLPSDAVFALSYATKSARSVHRGVVIAVDAAREVHWLYPAFTDPSHVPEPFELSPGRAETAMPSVVRLQSPAAGPLVVIALLDPAEPTIVQRIEASRPEDRTPSGLSALVRAGDVRTWQVTLTSADGGAQ